MSPNNQYFKNHTISLYFFSLFPFGLIPSAPITTITIKNTNCSLSLSFFGASFDPYVANFVWFIFLVTPVDNLIVLYLLCYKFKPCSLQHFTMANQYILLKCYCVDFFWKLKLF